MLYWVQWSEEGIRPNRIVSFKGGVSNVRALKERMTKTVSVEEKKPQVQTLDG